MDAQNRKRTTKPMALLLCLALVCAMWAPTAAGYAAPTAALAAAAPAAANAVAPKGNVAALAADELEGTYRWMVTGYDWGPAVNKIIISLNDSFEADDFDASYFTVRAGTNANPTTNRPITAAYPSDAQGNAVDGASSYITLELQVAQNVGTPFTYTFTTGFNTWTANYQHAVILEKPLGGYESWTLAADTASGPFGRYTPEYDRFENAQKEYRGINYHYAWFTPPEASADNKRPLIVWLHGAGEGGTDPSIILYGNKVVNLASDKIQSTFGGAFVLTPQARTAWLDRDGTGTYTTNGVSYYTESLMDLIRDFVDSTPNIDKDRVYITGCSNGGFMTVRLLVNYPGYFAAGVPICPVFSQSATEFWLTPEQAETTKDTPIWFVQATNDSLVNFANNGSKVYNALVDAGGGNLHFFAPTSVPYNTHWSWQFWLNDEAPCNADATASLRDCTGQCKPDVSAMAWLASQSKAAQGGGVPTPELSFGMGGGFGGPAGYAVSVGAPYVSADFFGPPGLISDEASAANYKFYYTTDGSDPTLESAFVQAVVMNFGMFGFVMAPSIPIANTCYVKVAAYDVSLGVFSEIAGILASTLALDASKESGLCAAEDFPLGVNATLNDASYAAAIKSAFYKLETRDASNGRLTDTSVTITPASNDGAYALGSNIAIADPGEGKAAVFQVYADVEVDGDVYPLTALYWYTSKAGLVKLAAGNIPQVVAEMYLADKIELLSGVGTAVAGLANTGVAGATLPLPAYGIPGISLSDGPTGVRMGSNATVWTNPTGIAATWNVDSIKAIADRVGVEATAYGVDYMLGPALNIQRNPLGGRDFEYYSEDPYVAGITAGYYTQALQARGVGATLKHYAANNQEQYRSGGIQYISERALREIYLRGFEMAVDIGKPWSVMSSYNRINGIYSSANTWLLTKALRDDFGFDGFVMTDWGGAHAPAEEWVIAQNDLAEPSYGGVLAEIMAWVDNDDTDLERAEKIAIIDRNVANILNGVVKTHTFKGTYASLAYADVAALSAAFADKTSEVYKGSVAVNRDTAAEAMVLLKNAARTLPLPAAKKVAIANTSVFSGGGGFGIGGGTSYGDFIVEGGGSAQVTFDPNYTVDFAEGFGNAGYEVVDDIVTPGVAVTAEKAAELAAAADYGVYIVSRPSSEGADNTQASFDLYAYEAATYEALASAFHAAGKPVIVLVNCGAAINVQAFKASADAILVTWLPGTEGGNALLDILTGKVNPSGKLAQSFPLEYNDSPSIAMAKENHAGRTWSSDPEFYDDGVFVGYRYFTTFGKEDRVAYPFGFGLSYTTFGFSDLELDKHVFPEGSDSETLEATVKVTNTGAVPGQQVVQLYLGADSHEDEGRPARELKAFAKTKVLAPGESEAVKLTIGKRDLQYYDDGNLENDLDDPAALRDYIENSEECWTVAPGTRFTVTVGDSSATADLLANGISDTFVYGAEDEGNLEGTFRWMVTGYDWGPAVNKIIIGLNRSFAADDFDASYFTVRAGTNANPTTNRPITAAYPSDAQGNAVDGASSYITLELQVAQNVGTPFTYTFTTGFNVWTANYQHIVILNKPLGGFESWALEPDVSSGPFGRYTPEYDRFENAQKEYRGINYSYAWFTPPEAAADNKRPLIIWLHGSGEGGTDPSIILYGNKVVNLASDKIQSVFGGAFVLTPQARTAWLDRDGSGTYTTNGVSYYTESLMDLIRDFVDSTPNIDKDRVYISGCSNGGFMTVRLLVDYPGYFAAGVPVCTVFSQNATNFWLTPEQAETTKDTPIWFVHATNDGTANYANNGAKVYNTLIDAGGSNLHFFAPTSVPYNSHWSWQFWLNDEAACNADATASLRDCTGQCEGVTAMEWLASQTRSLKFDLNVDVLEWGSATTAVIIDMMQDVDAADVAIDTFSVTAETRNPTNNALVYNGPRTVTSAYVSAAAEKGKPAGRGRYVVLELKYGFNNTAAEVNGCAALNYLSSRNYWLNQNYAVAQEKAIGDIEGSTLVYGKTVTPIYDDFILTSNPVAPYTGQTYRVYTPKGAAGPLPLVLWNHGAGETYGTTSGASNEGSQLFANMGGIGWVKNAPEDCVVIAPQRSLNGYSQAGVIAFIQDLVDKGVVDGNRIYVSGCSMGGQETDNFLIAYPSFFAAAIPICPAGSVSAAQAATIAAGGLPVWIVNAANDPTVNNASVTTMYNNMVSGGVDAYRTVFADVRGTEIPNADYATATYNGHWSWVMVLNNIDDIGDEARGPFMDWLFAQTRQVQVGIEAPAELDVDFEQDLGYSVTMRREMAGTNMAEITVAFDAAKLDYVGSDVKIPGWSFMSAPAVDPVAGTYHAYVWAGVAGEPLFTTYAAAEVLALGFKAKSHLTYKDVVEAALVSAKVSEKQADGLFYAAAAKLDPATAATTIIDHMRFDVNGDGNIDIADVSTVLYYYYLQRVDSCDFWYTGLEIPIAGGGTTLLPPARLIDANGDGIIDLGDILLICSYF